MSNRTQLVVFWMLGGAFLLFALGRDYLAFVSTGYSLWWLALEVVLLAAVAGSFILLEKTLPPVDLGSIKGIRAVFGIIIVLVAILPAIAAGWYLDSLLGLNVSFGAMLTVLATTLAIRITSVLLSSGVPVAAVSAPAGETPGEPSKSTPPN